nr:unnamed protein product [Spirometra erinaceieuropaei]
MPAIKQSAHHVQRSLMKGGAVNIHNAVAVDNQSIELAWETPDQNLVGLQIVLWVWTNGTPIQTLVDASVGAQKRTLNGLSPLTEYNTTLAFLNINRNLEDICNQTIKVLTFPNAPIIKVSDVGGSWMRITFEPTLKADSFNLINTAVAIDATGTRTSCFVPASIQEISCDIARLRSETEYIIIARTCIGTHCSVESPAISVKTLTEATNPTPVSTATPPEDSNKLNGGQIAGIVIGVLIGLLLVILPIDLAIETVELLVQGKYSEKENLDGQAQVLQHLKFCLSTYFTFDGTIYERVKSTPLDSPILVFVSEAVLQR